MGAAALAPACRVRGERALILRLSHSMTAGPTSLHILAQAFKEIAERKTNGAVLVRIFSSES